VVLDPIRVHDQSTLGLTVMVFEHVQDARSFATAAGSLFGQSTTPSALPSVPHAESVRNVLTLYLTGQPGAAKAAEAMKKLRESHPDAIQTGSAPAGPITCPTVYASGPSGTIYGC
jgi:hypothetical protein